MNVKLLYISFIKALNAFILNRKIKKDIQNSEQEDHLWATFGIVLFY